MATDRTQFLAGIATYYLWRRVPSRLPVWTRWAALSAMVAALSGLILVQGWYGNVVLVLACLSWILVAAALLLCRARWDIRWRPAILVGDVSYALYLIQPYVLLPLSRIMGRRFPALDCTFTPGMITALAVTTVLAIVVHRWIERPAVRTLTTFDWSNIAPVPVMSAYFARLERRYAHRRCA